MRTTLDIDDDLLAAAKKLARRQGATAGEVVSRLLRHALTGSADAACTSARRRWRQAAGFEPFPARPGVETTDAQVEGLRDAEGL